MIMRHIDYIVFHCSAGYAGVEGIRRFWRETLGWKMDGYHRFVLLNGDVDEMQPWSVVTNGVKGYNSRALHICYPGRSDAHTSELQSLMRIAYADCCLTK